MSRIIKKYPYNPLYKDEIQATAEYVKDFDLMGVSMDFIDIKKNDISDTDKVRFNSYCYAEEESKGVHVYLEEVDKEDTPTGYKTEELIVDEIEFIDETFKCLTGAYGSKISLDKSEYMQNILYKLANNYAQDKLKDELVFFQIPYSGIGYVYVDGELACIADVMSFAENTVIFDHCVGRIDKDNDCGIMVMFWTGKDNKTCINFRGIKLEDIYNDGTTYKYVFDLADCHIEFSEDSAPVIPPTKFSDSKDILDIFVSERSAILNADDEIETEDNMLDLL